ncbi:MAG: bifunctional 2-methylcitrate dehydratase/aconitate hydratase [Firmicutes bacterium]|nr:bifunctional 2-methylcitrate dehydratase/aconitate hydratase [Alicyclobacillaceae bacterium]MCL6497637.1 bifunctional 2-methylcitrate dehydratase/aconitate hydratase [Bacillota bacterium]
MTAPGAADELLSALADYVTGELVASAEAYDTARWVLLDTLGCGILALRHPECLKLLGPTVPGVLVSGGARVPGTAFVLDPVTAAFNIGAANRWLDFNDTWLAAEWGHPSDNLAALLAVADWLAQRDGQRPTVGDLLRAMIQAHEIQGVLALNTAFNRVGLDHVILVRIASTAVATRLLGGDHAAVIQAVSNAFLDNGPLRTYRHGAHTGWRKSWAAGDAAARAVQLALWTLRGEQGYPHALSDPEWGFYHVVLRDCPMRLERPLGCYVMENVLFKVAYPAEFHGQTAVEAAIRLAPAVAGRLSEVAEVRIRTQESARRIIDKRGPLRNPADRDHCLQYMVAVALLDGRLDADSYSDERAADPRIDWLRERTVVEEDPRYSRDYLDPAKRSIANAVQVRFLDGSATEAVEVEYPLGHRRRRQEARPLLLEKLRRNLATRFTADRVEAIVKTGLDLERLTTMPVHRFMDLWTLP